MHVGLYGIVKKNCTAIYTPDARSYIRYKFCTRLYTEKCTLTYTDFVHGPIRWLLRWLALTIHWLFWEKCAPGWSNPDFWQRKRSRGHRDYKKTIKKQQKIIVKYAYFWKCQGMRLKCATINFIFYTTFYIRYSFYVHYTAFYDVCIFGCHGKLSAI